MEQDSSSIGRALDLLLEIASDGGATRLPDAAAALGLPLSTAHRLIDILSMRGLIVRVDRGHYLPGPTALGLRPHLERGSILARAARAPIERLAEQSSATVHLGVFEDDMVTYLVKAEGGGPSLFTREGMQLEAYCSAIGKLLLADMELERREEYLCSGEFVPMTVKTIHDPGALREHLAAVARQAYAIDDEEVADNLHCIAVPVRDLAGRTIAAISRSAPPPPSDLTQTLRLLRGCADAIARRMHLVLPRT